jgi:DNA-binding transcriptional LysR family regulator
MTLQADETNDRIDGDAATPSGAAVQLGAEPRHLSALIAVAETGSFRGAAQRLGTAQSAVSQRVAQLERIVRTQLVERPTAQSELRLTDAGLAVLEHAHRILEELDAATIDVRAISEWPPRLRIGTYESVSKSILAGALKRLARGDPELSVELREDPDWPRFFRAVAGGQLDAAFAELPLEPGPFAFRELIVDPCVLVVRRDSPLARSATRPTLAEIAALPLIESSWPMLRLLADHLRTVGVEPRFVHRAALNPAVQAMVAEGLGAALQPSLSVDDRDPRTTSVNLDGILPPRRIALYWHEGRRHLGPISALLAALETEVECSPLLAAGAAHDRANADRDVA